MAILSSKPLNYTPAGRPIASSKTGGTVYSSGGRTYIAPISPSQSSRLYQTAQQYAKPATVPAGNVLGVQAPAPSGGGGNNLLETIPEQPTFDETPFNELIGQIDQLGDVFRSEFTTAEKGIQQRSQSELTDLENQNREAEENLTQYKTETTQDAERNIDEQRRQFAEVQQGLQARYGKSTGTGAFASELAGRHIMGNIGTFRQQLQNEYSKVQNMQNSLLRTYMSEKTKLSNQTEQLLAEAKNMFQRNLADLNIQKGQTRLAKEQQKRSELQQYQNTVAEIKARNTAYLRDLDQQQKELQNKLTVSSYKMEHSATQKILGFFQSFANSGVLTDEGLRSAESAMGLPPSSLQQPPKKKDPNSPEATAERAQALLAGFNSSDEEENE